MWIHIKISNLSFLSTKLLKNFKFEFRSWLRDFGFEFRTRNQNSFFFIFPSSTSCRKKWRTSAMDPSDNNPSSQQSLPYITSNNPLQFTIHLPNSTPNFTSIPNSNPSRDPNPNPNPNLNPNPHSDSISDQLLSLSIPTKRRRGRPRSTATSSLDQVYIYMCMYDNLT